MNFFIKQLRWGKAALTNESSVSSVVHRVKQRYFGSKASKAAWAD
jgi:hypothetical protein